VARRTAYTEQDKARVYVVLNANEGNVKRTARETDVPENTVRRWRDEWEKNGPPATDVVQQAVADHVDRAETVANKALVRMEEMIDNKEGTLAQVTTAYGVLRDKIDRAKGLLNPRPDGEKPALEADQIRELLVGYTHAMQELSAAREEEIIDAEIVEQPALPSGR
jgi:transposase-like protein